MDQNTLSPVGPQPVPPIRRVMVPVILFAVAWALLLGFNATERPSFTPLTGGGAGVALSLNDPDGAYSTALADGFVPASADPRARVLKGLGELRVSWQEDLPRITVNPLNEGIGTLNFARQLEQWFTQFSLGGTTRAAEPAPASLAGLGDGFVIRCRTADRALAQELALSLAPVLRGDVTIVYSELSSPGQLDIFIEAAPQFSDIGVAYFGEADIDA